MIIKINKYFIEFFPTPEQSKKKYKAVIYNDEGKKVKTLQFGSKGYEQYRDNTPLKLYSNLDHNDIRRKMNYRKRHSKILTKNGKPAYKDPLQASYYSFNFLWA